MKRIVFASFVALTIALLACSEQNPPSGEITPTPNPTATETTFTPTVTPPVETSFNAPQVVPVNNGTSGSFSKFE